MTDSKYGAGPEFDLAVEDDGQWAVVRLRGELDLASAPALAEAVERLAVNGTRSVRLDLTELDFCDSTGISAMLSARARMLDCGGALTVVGVQGKPLRVLALTGVLELLIGQPGNEGKP
jgi:anti-anti-sigma factor